MRATQHAQAPGMSPCRTRAALRRMKKHYVGSGRGIGGDFPLSVGLLCRRAKLDFREYFRLQPSHFVLFDSARSALRSLLATLAENRSGTVLLPSYLCPAVLQPLKELGLSFGFYRVTSSLELDLDDFATRMRSDVIAVLIIHYFGFPVSERFWHYWGRLASRPPLIEDCSQALLSRSGADWLGMRGDYSVTSLRKFLPVPDGAWLRTRSQRPRIPLEDGLGEFTQKRSLGMLLKAAHLESCSSEGALYETYRVLLQQAEKALDGQHSSFAASDLTVRLLDRIDYDGVVNRRRDNFVRALHRTETLTSVRPLFERLPEGVCPLGFPALAPSREVRDSLRQYLIARGVYPPVHWVLPSEAEVSSSDDSRSLSERIITIPTDQRYGRADMDYIGRLLAEFETAHTMARPLRNHEN
jgi:dTDP-4-amino-4,6-dideoxygalactose transaminase